MSGHKGEKNIDAKLTVEDVILMRYLADFGFTPTQLADVFDVSRVQIRRIIRGEKWKWLVAHGTN